MNLTLVIWFYMFICISLLVFNVVYILQSKRKKRWQQKKEQKWLLEIQTQCQRLEHGLPCSDKHLKRMESRLCHIKELLVYYEAVVKLLEADTPCIQHYLDSNLSVFQTLALQYSKKSAMERGFFAHVIAVCHPSRETGCGQLPQILMEYFSDSTVFCRENLLQAFYSIGDITLVEAAFTMLSHQGRYHYTRLLSDGLATFSGNQEELAWSLWKHRAKWNETIQIAIVQFATMVSDSFSGEFLLALKNSSFPLDLRFALLRYFQRYYYPEALPQLLLILRQEESSGLAIAATFALGKFTDLEARHALLEAMHSRSWYVRRGAAISLSRVGISRSEIEELYQSGDNYAIEMLNYVLGETVEKILSDVSQTDVAVFPQKLGLEVAV